MITIIKTCNFWAKVAIGLLITPLCFAQIVRLDDSASPRSQVQAQQLLSEQGTPLAETPNALFAIMQVGPVGYKLATSEFIGKRVNLYYVVPAQVQGLMNPDALTVRWQSRGPLSEGSLHAGGRQLVWSGTITEPWFSTEIDIAMQVQLSELRLQSNQPFGLECYFELEVLP